MERIAYICFLLVVCISSRRRVEASDSEFVCSKFPYEEKLLEKMIRMEIKVEDMVKEIKNTQEHVRTILDSMEMKMEDFASKYKTLAENVTKVFVDAKADLELYKEAMKNENIRFKDNLKTEIDIKGNDIDIFIANSTNELQLYKESLETEIDEKKKEVDTYKDAVTDELKTFMENITTDVDSKIADLELLEVKLGNPAVAFNVHKPLDLSIGTNEVFQYSDVLLNKGDGFNKDTGKFIAPITGIYYFSAHVCANGGKFVHYGIAVGSSVLASSSQREDTDSSCGSVSVVATVRGGEDVYVKCLAGNPHEAQINEGPYRWNSFTGVLIQ